MKKVAIVTGSARGIGYAIAEKLAQNDYIVILCDIAQPDAVQPQLEKIRANGGEVEYVRCDISSEESRQNLLEYTERKFARLDLLVNNAGVAPLVRADVLCATEESFDRLININLKGTFFMCQKFANLMLKLKAKNKDCVSRIVNITSMSVYTSSVSRAEYCITKAGISMATKVFADRLADEGIYVFEVRPGIIMTDMTAVVKDKYQKLIDEGVTPIKRFGKPEDVADCVYAAASGLLDFGTGSALNADGGFHIQRL